MTKLSFGSRDRGRHRAAMVHTSAGAARGTIHARMTIVTTFRLLLMAAMLTSSAAASAQSWADAYKAGDYKKAADLLHPLIIQSAVQPGGPQDPAPPRQLAMMYAEGLGVSKDPLAAC